MLELRIGAHHRDRSLDGLRRLGVLDELLEPLGAVPVWVGCDDSRRTIDLLCAGDLHIAGTGLVPPLRGQSEGVDLVYVAASERRSAAGAIVAASGSPVRDVHDLRGRRIGLARGSVPTHVLAAALDGTAMTFRDLDVVLDAHTEASGLPVDAWVLAGERDAALRELPGTRVEITARTVWFARRDVATSHADVLDQVVVALRRPPYRAQPIDREFVAEQQIAADLLARQGAIGLPVSVGAAVLTPVVA